MKFVNEMLNNCQNENNKEYLTDRLFDLNLEVIEALG